MKWFIKLSLKFMVSIKNTILKRKSVRRFEATISQDTLKQINEIVKKPVKTPFGLIPHFHLIDKKSNYQNDKLKLGTYGFISGAQYFIVGSVDKNEMACVDYGYALESIILNFTALNLGTCWLGGTFKKSEFAKAISVGDNEIMPAISPVGVEKRSFKNALIRTAINAHKRKPFEDLFFKNNAQTPYERNNSIYSEALEMVRLSPSADNFQPWRVIVEEKQYHFYIKRNKMLSNFKEVDLQKVDLGIAMSHFELFLNENKVFGQWTKDKTNQLISENLEYVATWQI